jgi:hypothetical protein
MSRYQITCRKCPQDGPDLDDCPYLVVVGWDDDLETYYGWVQDLRIRSDRPEDLLLRVGTEQHQLPSVHTLQEAIDPWAEIQDPIRDRLEADRNMAAQAPPGVGAYVLGGDGRAEDDDDLAPRVPDSGRRQRLDRVLRERRSTVVGATGGIPGASAQAEYMRLLRRHLVLAVPRIIMGLLLTFVVVVVTLQFLPLLAVAFAVAGLGITWRLGRPPDAVTAWRRGAKGERTTARLLAPLERYGFTVFHDLSLPGGRVNVDHLVIGPTGIWAIDSKSWRNRTVVDKDGRLWRGRRPADTAVRVAWWEAEQVANLFDATGLDVGVNPVLVIHGTQLRALEAIAGQGVRVVAPDYLAAVVSRPPATLLPDEAAALVERVRVVFGLPRPAMAGR